MIKLGFLLTNSLKVLVMYDSRCMFGRSFKETISSIFGAIPKDVLAGNCFCTSTLPRSQRMLEQFRDGIPIDSLNAVIYNESEQRDVQTPESGVDAGEDLRDSQGQDNIIYEDLRVSLNNSDISVYASTEKTKIQDDNHIITAGVHVLIGTPRRVCDLIKRKVLDADHIRAVVMDTPEELFCKGFIDQTRSVVQALPDKVEVVLLSRKTFLNDLREGFGSNSNRVERPDKFLLENVRHFYIQVVRDDLNMQTKELKGTNRNELMDKKKVQFDALCDLYPIMESRKSVILCNGKKKALRLYERIISKNFTVTCLAGRMKRTKREGELERFESASSGVAIVTEDRADYFRDKQISIVVNYDMPKRLKSYVRCVGWSGSGGDERIVVNLVGSKSGARLMETVKAAYGVPVKEISSPSDIAF
ncbi:hypothetical protein ANCCAN_17843 [Ancylostoma caninum]|uniref:RNA helicase n=1 Tax=Ancylostoma caninum TaxID=29170 RepID=A0A368FXQ3_ANCCA|nr:hypothetical protein ANCCAN_17843 [Ancylostoma caninum]